MHTRSQVACKRLQGLLVIDGLAQATGAILLSVALTNPTKRWVPAVRGAAFTITPVLRHDVAGATIQGTF